MRIVAAPFELGELLRLFRLQCSYLALDLLSLGFEFTNRNLDNPSPVLRLPMSIIYLPVALCFVSVGLRLAFRLLTGLREARP